MQDRCPTTASRICALGQYNENKGRDYASKNRHISSIANHHSLCVCGVLLCAMVPTDTIAGSLPQAAAVGAS